MKQQLIHMLQIQDSLNSKINPNWIQAGNQWYRAIWVECAEMLDHYGWKWWKKQTPDIAQAKIELIDIWHFGLSDLLVTYKGDIEEAADTVLQVERYDRTSAPFLELTELFALETLETRHFDTVNFFNCLNALEMSLDELYLKYIGKYTLNVFRQDHGYNQGTYIKIWNGNEDNVHLDTLITKLYGEDSDTSTLYDRLYVALQEQYTFLIG